MHEYSIVAALIHQVEAEVASRGATRVHRLHVDIGELAGVEVDLLATAFETFRPGTACDGADFAIRSVAATWQCSGCGCAIDPGAILRCPHCGRPGRLTEGDEIVLARLELEVPDV